MDKDSEVERTDQDDSEDEGVGSQAGRKSITGQACTLKTLIDDEVVKPGDSVLHMEYMGHKFDGDLLPSGSIRWSENKQVFSTPSSWVNHCKRMVNPENSGKTGSAWSTIRYFGKRLDTYKLKWYRKQKKIINNANLLESALVFNPAKVGSLQVPSSTVTSSNSTCDGSNLVPIGIPAVPSNVNLVMFKDFHYPIPTSSTADDDPVKMKERNVVEHSSLASRHPSSEQDVSVLVKCVPFSALDRIQPFTMTMSTNALLLIDFHCHLTTGEVTGYLGGSWDLSSHNLSVLQAFPCRARLADRERSSAVEEEIRQNLASRNLSVVGWYHSHPRAAPHPSVKDVENQIEYQIVMKGETESSYIPCIGFICSPYDAYNEGLESSYQSFWVMPPPEFRPYEYGRPLQMLYSITRDSFLTQDLLLEMRLLAHFYVDAPDAIKFNCDFKIGMNQGGDQERNGSKNVENRIEATESGNKSNSDDHVSAKSSSGHLSDSPSRRNASQNITFWEKLQGSLRPNLPRDLQVVEGQSLAQAQVQEQALAHFWAFLRGLLIPENTPAQEKVSDAPDMALDANEVKGKTD